MKLNNIKSGSIIIAPTYLHDNIRKSLLEDTKGIINISIYSLSTYLNGEYKDASTYEYYVTLKQIKDQLFYQRNSVSSLSFINEVKTLITHMKEYQIPCSRLPETNEVEKELKKIIEQLYPITLPIDITQKSIIEKIP